MTTKPKIEECKLLTGEALDVARDIKQLDEEREHAMRELQEEFNSRVQQLHEACHARRTDLWEQMHALTETDGNEPWQLIYQFLDDFGHAYIQRVSRPNETIN